MVTGKKRTFVLYPSLGVGHLIPMVELAKHLLRHGHGALIAVVNPPDTDAVSAAAVERLAAANPAIAFRLLPVPASPDAGADWVKRDLDTLRLANPVLRDFLLRSQPAAALILDMFCVDALDVAAELGVPTYFFFASAAGTSPCSSTCRTSTPPCHRSGTWARRWCAAPACRQSGRWTCR
jgi:hypothetical protein